MRLRKKHLLELELFFVSFELLSVGHLTRFGGRSRYNLVESAVLGHMVGHVGLELVVLNVDLGTVHVARITSTIVHLLMLLLDRHLLLVLLVMIVRSLLMLLFDYSLDRRGSRAMHLGFCLRGVVL